MIMSVGGSYNSLQCMCSASMVKKIRLFELTIQVNGMISAGSGSRETTSIILIVTDGGLEDSNDAQNEVFSYNNNNIHAPYTHAKTLSCTYPHAYTHDTPWLYDDHH